MHVWTVKLVWITKSNIKIKNKKFSIKNVTKWQHWRHFRNVCFLGGVPRHATHRVQNLIWSNINFLIYMRIARKTLRRFKKYWFLCNWQAFEKKTHFSIEKTALNCLQQLFKLIYRKSPSVSLWNVIIKMWEKTRLKILKIVWVMLRADLKKRVLRKTRLKFWDMQ